MGVLDEATASLERMQTFDPDTLIREAELGSKKNFRNVVEPAKRLIALYARLSPLALQDFPDEKLNEIKNRANSDYQLFTQIQQFDPDSTTVQRDQLIANIAQAYGPTFNTLHPLVAYSLHRSADFQRLDGEARATLQGVRDSAAELTRDLEESKTEARRILEEVRAAAAEQGVSQQAYYFKDTADAHTLDAETWRSRVIRLAWLTGLFAILSLLLHKLPYLKPEGGYDAVQIAVSKVLIFGVLSYMLYLSARNFLSHKHNAIVNRHRQQALQTYQALVSAAGDGANRDIVLTHAAACIFGPQNTGYSVDATHQGSSAKSVVELLGAQITKGATP